MHEGQDLPADVELLRYLLDGAREEIVRLRAQLGDRAPQLFKIAGAGKLPARGYIGDAGFDLYVAGDWTIAPGAFLDIPCEIRCEIPDGMWAMITGRSSTLRQKGLMVAQGIIDNGYRGALFAGVWNLTGNAVQVRDGERVAQLILFPLMSERVELVRVMDQEITESDRGTKGFGSSGV